MVTNTLITPDVDFKVTKSNIHTAGDNIMLPNDVATVRTNNDGTRVALAVVSKNYQVVDHRTVLMGFSQVLDNADLIGTVKHNVYRRGARVYSTFVLDRPVMITGSDANKQAYPFFTLTNSYDGALKVGFILGAMVNNQRFYLSPRVYGVSAKHLGGIKLDNVLKDISEALDTFANDVVPLWRKMMITKLSLEQTNMIIARAVKNGVLTARRSAEIMSSPGNMWNLYSRVIGVISAPGKKVTVNSGESSVWRNARANKYFIDELQQLTTAT